MKILWVSPHGDGWAIAQRLREAGNKVVLFCPDPENKNGAGYLPRVTSADWQSFAERSDLVIVDGNFPSRPTRRSWEPSNYSLQLQQLRHRGVTILGPTPTTELLENDPRYRQKVLTRVGLNGSPDDQKSGVRVTLSQDPEGRTCLVFRHRTLLGDGNGPEVGNLGDVVIPVPADIKLARDVVKPLDSFLSRISYYGYINLGLVVTHDTVTVQDIHCRFLYPAIFAQFADLLAPLLSGIDSPQVRIGLAVTLLRLEQDSPEIAEQLEDSRGFFGCGVMRKLDGSGPPVAAGRFVGAVVGLADDWDTVQQKVNSQLNGLVRTGWGWRENVGETLMGHLTDLRKWGWID